MKKSFLILMLFLLVWPNFVLADSDLAERLSGRILLQVEENGEAWYVNPISRFRYYMGRPDDAFTLMRAQGVGITDKDLSKIKVGLDHLSGADSDGDGLPDDFEVAIGTDKTKKDTDGDGHFDKDELNTDYNPAGEGKLSLDPGFAQQHKGKIFLQVEKNGEAWYVNPVDGKRYFLGRPGDAFSLMRALGLGITNKDLADIRTLGEDPVVESSEVAGGQFDLLELERTIHDLINNERRAYGLKEFAWDDGLAQTARKHSQGLANENKEITDINLICDYPMIHHEGLEFGLYVSDRLDDQEIYNFSKNGENIALVSAGTFMFLSGAGEVNVKKAEECRNRLNDWENNLRAELEMEDSESIKISIILSEMQKRKERLAFETLVTEDIRWKYPEEIMEEMVEGWMNSPGHRANILDMEFDLAGVGLSFINGYIIGTQVFVKKVDCGYKNGPCCERGGCYVPLSCSNENNCE